MEEHSRRLTRIAGRFAESSLSVQCLCCGAKHAFSQSVKEDCSTLLLRSSQARLGDERGVAVAILSSVEPLPNQDPLASAIHVRDEPFSVQPCAVRETPLLQDLTPSAQPTAGLRGGGSAAVLCEMEVPRMWAGPVRRTATATAVVGPTPVMQSEEAEGLVVLCAVIAGQEPVRSVDARMRDTPLSEGRVRMVDGSGGVLESAGVGREGKNDDTDSEESSVLSHPVSGDA